MPKANVKNTITNSQYNISTIKTSIPTTSSLEYSNIAEEQQKELKRAFMDMIEILREEINK